MIYLSSSSFRASSDTDVAPIPGPSPIIPGPTHAIPYGLVQRNASLDTKATYLRSDPPSCFSDDGFPPPVVAALSLYIRTQLPASSVSLVFDALCFASVTLPYLWTRSCARICLSLTKSMWSSWSRLVPWCPFISRPSKIVIGRRGYTCRCIYWSVLIL